MQELSIDVLRNIITEVLELLIGIECSKENFTIVFTDYLSCKVFVCFFFCRCENSSRSNTLQTRQGM